MKKGKIIFIHLLAWILLSVIYFLLSEQLTNWILPEIHEVETWLTVLAVGLFIIFIGMTISLAIILTKEKKK